MKPKTIVLLVLAGLFLIILVQNTQVVTLQLLFWKVEMSRIIFIPLVMLIGLGIGFVLGSRRRRHKNRVTEKKESA